MSSTIEQSSTKLNFRRYREGDQKWKRWQDKIFQADHTYKCPTYIQAVPPCQGSCPSGEDIRGWLNIVRGIEKPPAGVPWQEYAVRRLTEANPVPAIMGRVCPLRPGRGPRRRHPAGRSPGAQAAKQIRCDHPRTRLIVPRRRVPAS